MVPRLLQSWFAQIVVSLTRSGNAAAQGRERIRTKIDFIIVFLSVKGGAFVTVQYSNFLNSRLEWVIFFYFLPDKLYTQQSHISIYGDFSNERTEIDSEPRLDF